MISARNKISPIRQVGYKPRRACEPCCSSICISKCYCTLGTKDIESCHALADNLTIKVIRR